MAERKTQSRAVKNPVKRKLTRAEKKEIAAVIQAAKGDGKPHTAQQTIPYLQMYPDGICRVTEKKYSKSLVFEDINYQLAQADDKTAIFENWCDFLNYFDASVSVQLSFINQGARKEKAQAAIEIPAQDDAFNSIRKEYADMLKNQLEKGNNGLEKCKYITFSIEADNLAAAKARLSRIETDVLNNFKVLGVTARPMNGQERLNVLHGIFHPEGEPFRFSWDWLVPSGLTTKDFIAPSSFRFGDGRTFRMGRKLGAVSFLEILAPELNDRMLSDILDLENGIIVNLHIRSIDQSEAIKTIKRKITDLDKMLIVQDQVWNRVTVNRAEKKATRYYMDEFHLLLKEEQTAAYSVEIWKRFRKWGGIPTAITQNVKDLLISREVENIFENSDFVLMLNQAQGDRAILAKQLNISPQQMKYVTHTEAGEGLIFYGNVVLPFIDRFPTDTELYRLLTTKPEEVSKA